MNGFLRTPKLSDFNNLISWLNAYTGSNIPQHTADTSDVLGNAWLAGFIDADGSFDIHVRNQRIVDGRKIGKDRVEARFRLEQRQSDPKTGESYSFVLGLIAKALATKLSLSIHHGTSYYLITVTSSTQLPILVDYLDAYQLFTSKYLDYVDWRTVQQLMLTKGHITPQGREFAKSISAGMNSTRSVYH